MRWFLFLFTFLVLTACGGKQQKDREPMADTGRTERTEHLLASLKRTAGEGRYLFGHHDDTVYGIGWVGDEDRSDVQSVCGDKPAVLSFDLGHLELGDSVNLDGVPFSRMRQEIVRHFDRGGMVCLSWHLNNPLSGGTSWVADSLKEIELHTVEAVLEGGEQHERFLGWLDRVADFLNSLETPYGIKVPVVFRPWHEHTGSWFWWGQEGCTADQYRDLWKLTTERLKEKGVVNVLYAYSPNMMSDGGMEIYMERYPGDERVDIIGFDQYCFAAEGDTAAVAAFAADLDRNLDFICKAAQQHGKVAALTETGYEGVKDAYWWTHTLMPVLAKHAISYVLVWRNAHDKPGHFYAPYPGHLSASDFVAFYNDPKTLFLKDVNGLYLKAQ
jgi:mannan endo-1,4-beta-mannosidase